MDAKLECEVDVEGTVVMMVRGYEDHSSRSAVQPTPPITPTLPVYQFPEQPPGSSFFSCRERLPVPRVPNESE